MELTGEETTASSLLLQLDSHILLASAGREGTQFVSFERNNSGPSPTRSMVTKQMAVSDAAWRQFTVLSALGWPKGITTFAGPLYLDLRNELCARCGSSLPSWIGSSVGQGSLSLLNQQLVIPVEA